MAALIASSVAQTDSADIVLAGTGTTLALVSADGNVPRDAQAVIQYKSAAGQYTTVDTLSAAQPAVVLTATGTFRVRKYASAVAYGVDRD